MRGSRSSILFTLYVTDRISSSKVSVTWKILLCIEGGVPRGMQRRKAAGRSAVSGMKGCSDDAVIQKLEKQEPE